MIQRIKNIILSLFRRGYWTYDKKRGWINPFLFLKMEEENDNEEESEEPEMELRDYIDQNRL